MATVMRTLKIRRKNAEKWSWALAGETVGVEFGEFSHSFPFRMPVR